MKAIKSIKEYRKKYGVSLKDVPLEKLREPALVAFEEITGYKPNHTEFEHIWHHQVSKHESSNSA